MKNLWALSLVVIIAPLVMFGFYKDNTKTSVRVVDGVEKHKIIKSELAFLEEKYGYKGKCMSNVKHSGFFSFCRFYARDVDRVAKLFKEDLGGLGWVLVGDGKWCRLGVMAELFSSSDSKNNAPNYVVLNVIYNSRETIPFCPENN